MDKFYEEHMEKVFKFFYIKSLNRAIAEDLTSETFVSFVTQNQHNTIESPTKYLYGIMRNVWIKYLKDKYKLRLVELENIEDFEDYSANVVSKFEKTETPIKRLQPYIDLLPPKQKLVLTLRIFEEKSVRETAEELGRDSNYVKTTYQRALKSLRQMLHEPYQQKEAQL